MNTRKSENGIAAEPASGETLGTRFLIEHPVRGWRVISAKRVFAAQRGELLMPELGNRTIRVADADVGIRSGKLVALLSVTFSEWRLDAEGRVDRAALMTGVIEKLDQRVNMPEKNAEKLPREPSQAEIDVIRLALGLPRT